MAAFRIPADGLKLAAARFAFTLDNAPRIFLILASEGTSVGAGSFSAGGSAGSSVGGSAGGSALSVSPAGTSSGLN